MAFQCSYPGCDIATARHYCREHRRHCVSCGLEWCDLELVDGRCYECRRNNEAYDGCESACCAENRANVRVDSVSRWV